MSATQEETTRNIRKDTPPESDPTKDDRAAPARNENSLGAESVRNGGPATHDSTFEAIDEMGPVSPLRTRTRRPPSRPSAPVRVFRKVPERLERK